MQTKVCTKCNRELPISQFQADKKLKFGVGTCCKDCKREYRQANKNKLLVAQYKRVAENKTILSPMRKAWNAVYYALKTGKIHKPDSCSVCGDFVGQEKIQAHHEDYSKPFEVTWCCQDCHVKLDAQRREVDCARHLCPNT